MRSWESGRPARNVRKGSDSQDRMDRIITMAKKDKDVVNSGNGMAVGMSNERAETQSDP